ncbi:hypothetical protein DY000_02039436 [Brassica cretica]|uniref:DUF4005 domain-containing protein n=1 Tax=Brassica cretica TaxID=69181 RepID=A0ABQ7BCF1_BRACR|nr:hypothetical protein DY000_02039436 [Brassica cretica]
MKGGDGEHSYANNSGHQGYSSSSSYDKLTRIHESLNPKLNNPTQKPQPSANLHPDRETLIPIENLSSRIQTVPDPGLFASRSAPARNPISSSSRRSQQPARSRQAKPIPVRDPIAACLRPDQNVPAHESSLFGGPFNPI